nr:LysR family transcriptional regulator [Burkholderia sp. Ac-20384]
MSRVRGWWYIRPIAPASLKRCSGLRCAAVAGGSPSAAACSTAGRLIAVIRSRTVVNIRKLRHALGLAQHLTFSRASVDVNLSQPALSRSIQSIEAELGVALFDRHPNGVSLTPYGKVFAERARRIVMEATELQRDLALMQHGEFGELSIGLGATPAILLTGPLMDHFLREAPQVRVSIKRGRRDTLLRRLLEEHVDLFIGDIAQLEDHADLQLTRLPRWPSGFFCTPDHPLARRDAVTRDELLQHRLGSIELSPWALSDLCEYFECSFDASISFRSDDFRDVEAAASVGGMVVFGNAAAFRDALRRGTLVELPLDPPFRREARLGLVTLAARTLSPAAMRAKALAESVFADCAATALGAAQR